MPEKKQINDGGAAFPVQRWDVEHNCVIDASESGMTLRDYFAAQTLGESQRVLGHLPDYPSTARDEAKRVAEAAYLIADAMIAERKAQS